MFLFYLHFTFPSLNLIPLFYTPLTKSNFSILRICLDLFEDHFQYLQGAKEILLMKEIIIIELHQLLLLLLKMFLYLIFPLQFTFLLSIIVKALTTIAIEVIVIIAMKLAATLKLIVTFKLIFIPKYWMWINIWLQIS